MHNSTPSFRNKQRSAITNVAYFLLVIVFFEEEMIQSDGKKSVKSFSKPSNDTKISISRGLYKAANILKKSINEAVNPCDDFYEFSCGKWISAHKIHKDTPNYSQFLKLEETINRKKVKKLLESTKKSSSHAINIVRQYYKKCMNVSRLNELKSSLLLKKIEEFGYWQLIHGDKWSPDSFDLTKLILQTTKSSLAEGLFVVGISIDRFNTKRNLIRFSQGESVLGLNNIKYYLNKTQFSKEINAYTKYMRSKIALLASDAGLNRTDEEIAAGVKSILDFETEMAKIMVPPEELLNLTKLYNQRKLSDMSSLFGEINWIEYLQGLSPVMRDYVANDPVVIVSDVKYLARLSDLLKKTDRRTLVDFLMWQYFSKWNLQLDKRHNDIKFDFYKSFFGQKEKVPRWMTCKYIIDQKMNSIISAMYVRKYFKKQTGKIVSNMIDNIKHEFVELLKESDWMEKKTKRYAIKKTNKMLSFITNDLLYNDTALDERFANFTIGKNEDFATLNEKLTKSILDRVFKSFNKPVSRSEIVIPAEEVNAYYTLTKNLLIIPPAILHSPFFDPSFPKAVNYGAIGSIIGHEIVHAFDNSGSQFDEFGNLKNWWEPVTFSKYKNRTQCIIDQYSSYEVPKTNMTINGVLTQGENVADNIGMKGALHAYRKFIKKLGREEDRLPGLEKYTNDQIFFLSFANNWCSIQSVKYTIYHLLNKIHSPERFRVNGVVVNQPEFAAAFHCPVGSPMNPEKKCSVW